MTCLDLSNGKEYDALLQYVLKECDEVSFHFPVLDEKTYNTEDLADDFKIYTDERQKFLIELFKHGATQEKAKFYQGIRLGYQTQIVRVRLYPKLIERFKKHHLYNWVWWNGLPEDPCFFSQNKCRFLTISHEELFYVYDDKKDCCLIRQIEK